MVRNALLVVTLGLIGVTLLLAFAEAPPITAPLSKVAQIYNAETVAQTSAANVIAAINFDWRAYDTLGEATILLTAASGVAALMRRYLGRRRETGVS